MIIRRKVVSMTEKAETNEAERTEDEDVGRGDGHTGAVIGRIHLALLRLAGLVTFQGRSFLFVPTAACLVYVHCSLLIVTSMYACGAYSRLTRSWRSGSGVDIQAIAETVGLCGVHARYLLMFARRGKLARILDESESLRQQASAGEEALIRKFVARSSRLAKFYILVNVSMCIFYLTSSQLPLFDTRNAENFNRSLPYLFYTEVNEKSAYFAAAVTVQMLGMIGVCVSSWGVDNSEPFLIMLACGHFRILCARLDSLHRSAIKVSEADIIKFCKEIDQLLSPIFFVQLLSSTYNIALVGLKLVDDDPDKAKYASVFVIMLFQLFVCQWAPDILVTESGALFKCAYFIPDSNDDDYNAKTLKLIQMIIMRAQQSVQLKAGGYLTLSMETFGYTVKGIASFFMVLRSFS